MKTNKYTKCMAAVLLAGAPLLWSACTDDWNEHYNVVPGGMAEQASLLEKIKEDPSLANFYKVLSSIGGAETLDSPQQLTVWAPKNFTEEQADSVIAIYNEDVQAGVRLVENRAIKQFMQNHVALYARPISSLTDTSIVMLNKKYMTLVGESAESGSLEGNPFSEMEICNNGILYKTENMQQFFPNIREYAELNGLDSVASFIKFFDDYELDEKASVEGGIINGKTVYLDSVTHLYNRILSSYGLIQREDSDYIFVAPTNEVWQAEYEKFRKYYNYNQTVSNSDSLANVLTQLKIYSGRFFNMSRTSKYNQHPEDSLTNTLYWENQKHNPRTNVFYNPNEGLLNGLEKVQCSNGYIYVDNKGTVDPRITFFNRSDVEAESSFNYEIPMDKDNKPTMDNDFTTLIRTEVVDSVLQRVTEDGDSIWRYKTKQTGEYRFVAFKAKTGANQTDVTYTLPSTFSNVYYNIYVVTVPGRGSNSTIPDYLSSYFTVECKAQNETGKLVNQGVDKEGNPTTANAFLINPHKYDAESDLTGYNELKGQSNFDRAFASSPSKVDTILLAKAKSFDFSSVGTPKGNVTLQFKSFGPSATKTREVVYTRTLRFDEFILVPFETKEEAEAAADDLDAINDVVLELKKAMEKEESNEEL